MKKFIKELALFSALTLILSIVGIKFLNIAIITDNFYEVDTHINTIIVGDSHSECAYNDSLIQNFKNFAQSGESYFYTYLKVKKILEHNPQIKHVLIEFNNGQVIKNMNDCIWDDEHLSSKVPKYIFAMEIPDYLFLFRHNFSGTMNALSISALKNIKLIKTKERTMHHYDWGRYKYLTNNGEAFIHTTGDTLKKMDDKFIEISEANLEYLLKTVSLCHEKKVSVTLVRSPVHPKYPGLANEKTFQFVRKGYVGELNFIDFKDFPIKDHEFADLHHLNFLSAEKYSLMFNNLWREKTLE